MHGVSIWAVRALVVAVERAGIPRKKFLAHPSLLNVQLDVDGARVAFDEYQRMVSAAIRATSDPALGLHMGATADPAGYDVLGALMQHSETLRGAIEAVNRYAILAADSPRFAVQERGETATIRLRPPEEGALREAQFFAEFAMAGLACHILPAFMPEQETTWRVCFSYDAPTHEAVYRRTFDGRVSFARAFTGIELERRALDYKPTQRSAELLSMLRARAEMLLHRLDRGLATTERVRRWLSVNHFEHRPTMRDAARSLGMSERSLRRQLAREAIDFTELVGRSQAARASQMLETGLYSVQEVAYELGFVNPAAFTRAYKRWTGKTPTEAQSVFGRSEESPRSSHRT